MTWEKLPALDGRPNPCLCCPPIPAKAEMDKLIAVGFGAAFVSRDGLGVLDGEKVAADAKSAEEMLSFADAEKLAAADPDHDWRVHLHGPLHGEVYQRQGAAEWILVESDRGFA